MENFLDIVLPPFLLLAGVLAIAGGAVVLVTARLRLWAAQRHRITEFRAAFQAVADALAGIIIDPRLSEETRAACIGAYAQVKAVLATAEKEGKK